MKYQLAGNFQEIMVSNTSSQVVTPRTSQSQPEVTSKTFPPLLWSEVEYKQRLRWPFPVINGERTKASAALLGVREKLTKDDCSDMPEALW